MALDTQSRRQRMSDYAAPPLLLLFLILMIGGSDDAGFQSIGAVTVLSIGAYGITMIFAAGKRPRWLHGFLIGVGAGAGFALLLGGNAEIVAEAFGLSLGQSAIAAAIMPPVGRLVIRTGDDAEPGDLHP